MTVRDSIVAALATVPGLLPSITNPPAPVAGSAWPQWTITNYQGGKLCDLAVHDYDVVIVLPNDVREETVESADGFLPIVQRALSRVGTVVSAQPVTIQMESAAAMPGIRVRLTPRRR
jgi:hypothetical protein